MRKLDGESVEDPCFFANDNIEIQAGSPSSLFLPHPWETLFKKQDQRVTLWSICENVLKRQEILEE